MVMALLLPSHDFGVFMGGLACTFDVSDGESEHD